MPSYLLNYNARQPNNLGKFAIMIIHQPRYSKEEIDVAASDADPLVGMVLLYGFKLQNKHQLYA